MVSTSYPRDEGDWRGLFIRDLGDALGRRADLRLLLWAPPGKRPDSITDATTIEESRWLDLLTQSGGIAHMLRSNALRGGWIALRLLRHLRRAYARNAPGLDVVHCNWLQTMLPVPRKLPVLVTVLGSDMQLLKLPLMPVLLRRAMRGRPVAICPNADWMAGPLRAHFGGVAEVQTVPFGVDARWFTVRRQLPSDPPSSWLLVARVTRDKLGELFAWGEQVFADKRRELHLFGPMQEQINLPGWVHYHGPVTSTELCRHWFPRAHGLITLSRHSEGRPQVMLEAMAAGLPIIASQLPAHGDLLEQGRTGMLCASQSEFADAILRLEDGVENHRVGVAARAWVRDRVGTWDDCASRYVELYRELVAGARR